MSEYALYLGAAVLVAVTIFNTNFIAPDSRADELRAQAVAVQQHDQFASHTLDSSARQ